MCSGYLNEASSKFIMVKRVFWTDVYLGESQLSKKKYDSNKYYDIVFKLIPKTIYHCEIYVSED